MTKKGLRILVVDDDRDILDLLKYNLEREGFFVKTLASSVKAVSTARDFCPDLILLDIMMPHPNGIELCRELRSINRFKETYIFFLTAKSENYYHQAALDTGGDDFIEKMSGLRALTAKINAVLKGSYVIRKSVPMLQVGDVALHRGAHSVSTHGISILLSRTEFELLYFFAQNARRVISIDDLIHVLCGSEIFMMENSIELYIENIMAKTGLELIKDVGGGRYRFAAG